MSIGLVLTGGSLKGICGELGALKYLHDQGVRFSKVVGVSAGAVVGGYYCAGRSPGEIISVLSDITKEDYLDVKWSSLIWNLLKGMKGYDGLVKGEAFRKKLQKDLGKDTQIEECSPELHIVVSNMSRVSSQVKSSGPLAKTIRASSAIPFVFSQEKINGEYYLDGGVADNTPLNEMIELDPSMDEYVVLSVLNLSPEEKSVNNGYMDEVFTPFRILAKLPRIVLNDMKLDDLQSSGKKIHRYEIELKTDVGLLDPEFIPEAIAEAYQYARKHIGEELPGRLAMKAKHEALRHPSDH